MEKEIYGVTVPGFFPENELQLTLIRHGETYGNSLRRYIGRKTDESLSADGIEKLKKFHYDRPELLFASPMKRCIETAALLFPGQPPCLIDETAECDFGMFENKNYKELNGNPQYQEWIDSQGMLPFPGGESREEFRERCQKGFLKIINICNDRHVKNAAVVTHGGTIMHIMDGYAQTSKNFYDWRIENGEALQLRIDGGK